MRTDRFSKAATQRVVAMLLVVATVIGGATVAPADADDPATMTPVAARCQASTARLGATTYGNINPNPSGTPCTFTVKEVLPTVDQTLPGGLRVLASSSGVVDNRRVASALIQVPSVNLMWVSSPLPLYHLILDGIHARAFVGPRAGTPGCSSIAAVGESTVTMTWAIGLADRVEIVEPMTIPLGLGVLYLNHQVKTATSVTQRAVFLGMPGTQNDVVLGEAVAELTCV